MPVQLLRDGARIDCVSVEDNRVEGTIVKKDGAYHYKNAIGIGGEAKTEEKALLQLGFMSLEKRRAVNRALYQKPPALKKKKK